MLEHHKDRPARIKVQRHHRPAIFNLVLGGLGLTSIGMPQLGFPALNTKAGHHIFGTVLLIRHKVDISIAIAPVSPNDVGIVLRRVVLKVRRRLFGGQNFLNRLAPINLPLAIIMFIP